MPNIRSGNLDIKRKLAEAKRMKVALPKLVGNEATNFFKGSFVKQGFTDRGFVAWKEVQRRVKNGRKFAFNGRAHWDTEGKYTGFTKSDRRRGILIKSGNLKRSPHPSVTTWPRVEVRSDLPYAAPNNDGARAGRGGKAIIPERKFIGPSHVLNTQIEPIIKESVIKILNA